MLEINLEKLNLTQLARLVCLVRNCISITDMNIIVKAMLALAGDKDTFLELVNSGIELESAWKMIQFTYNK